MVKKEKLFKIVGGAMALSVLLIGGVALAGGKTNLKSVTDKFNTQRGFGHQGMGFRNFGHGGFGHFGFELDNSEVLQTALNNLVTKGEITQDKVKAVQDYFTKKAEEKKAELEKIKNLSPDEAKKLFDQGKLGKLGAQPGTRVDLFSELVTNKILTQVQADDLKTQIEEVSQKLQQEKQTKELQAALNKLVEKGTLTKDKVREVQDYIAKKAAERKAEFDKIKSLTPEELQKYLADKKGDKLGFKLEKRFGPYSELVDDKILTQDQATALTNQIMEDKKAEEKQKLADSLNSLVEKSTITKDQADKVISKLDAFEKEQQALLEKLKAMTHEERSKYLQDNKKEVKNPLDQLVAKSVITNEQAKIISNLLPFHKGPMGGMRASFDHQGSKGPMGMAPHR